MQKLSRREVDRACKLIELERLSGILLASLSVGNFPGVAEFPLPRHP